MIQVLANTANSYSLLVSREMSLQINTDITLKINVDIIMIEDDDGNLRIDSNVTDYISITHKQNRITGFTNIKKFLAEYGKNNKVSIDVKSFILKYYKSHKQDQIKSLAKEYNINFCEK